MLQEHSIPSPDSTFLIGTQLDPKNITLMVKAIYPIHAGNEEIPPVAAVEYAVKLSAIK